MFACQDSIPRPRITSGYGVLIATIFCLTCLASRADAQNNFNSGSSGADGAFAPTTNQTLTLPPSGVFNFTTIIIPSGVTINFTRNAANTPVTLLASGSVVIGGSVVLDGQPGNANGYGGAAGPGGFNGGTGGYRFDSFGGSNGDGRCGGGGGGSESGSNEGGGGGAGNAIAGQTPNINGNIAAHVGQGGGRCGTSTVLPLVGGSGGGGGGAHTNSNGGAGGGGGGAILIASSISITFSGSISARGGDGATISSGGAGGGGAGGAVRLVANTLSGTGSLNAGGGLGGTIQNFGDPGGNGGAGYLRIEAYDYSNFNPNSNAVALSASVPNPAILPNTPQLTIASVAGVSAPASPLGSLHAAPDIIVPASQANPVAVAIQGSNVPIGTVLQVTVTPAMGASSTVLSSTLSGGSLTATTATASVTLPSGMSVISAVAVIDLTTAKADPIFMNGERVKRIEVAAVFGGASEVTYVTLSGHRIKRAPD